MNLVELLHDTVSRQPNHPAVLGPGRDDCITYAELDAAMATMADRLAGSGVQPGDCVGLHCRSGLRYIIANYALWRHGACVAPIPVELTGEEKERICRDISLHVVLSESGNADAVEMFRDGDVRSVDEDFVVFPARQYRPPPPAFADMNAAFLRFSSGTTATAKGVILSHESIRNRINAANDVLAIGPDDRIIWLLSMSYHFAVSIVAYLSFGATIVLCPTHFGKSMIETAVRTKGTFIYGSPNHYALMAYDRSGLMMPDVRLAISTAMTLPAETADAFYRRFDIPLSEAYGIIECGLPCINHDDAIGKRGSVGRVLPAYELRLDDVGLGEEYREIKVRGEGLLDAYYDPWRTRDEIMADGWFSTGDLGALDEDGYLFIQGRSKEMINVGGVKFFPQEVEAVLTTHPAIKEASVFSHDHRHLGEIGWAHVVLEPAVSEPPAEEELIRHCGEHLAPFKIPQRVIFVDKLERSASGKIIRRATPKQTPQQA